MNLNKWTPLLGAAAFAAFGLPAYASPPAVVSFDSPLAYALGDCTPGCTAEFQQLYSSSGFSGPLTITSIQFDYTTGDADDTYVFSLSTSPSTIDNMSNTFADNIGANNQVFYSGPLVAPNASYEATFVGTPFYYDPSKGDLLLDITNSGGSFSSDSESTYIGTFGSDSPVNRLYTFGPSATGYGEEGIGLETTFNASAAPEPASWALMILGLGGLGGTLRRRRGSGLVHA